jgi:hypothetical protein
MLTQPAIAGWRHRGLVALAGITLLTGVEALGQPQSTWTLQSPASHPVALLAPQMAYDALHQKTVLFSGTTSSGAVGNTPNDTWLWDGQLQSWTQMNPSHHPAGRVSAGFAYDSARQQIVMFGGGVGNTTFGDTWVWDGTDWTQKFPAVSPPARQAFSMAYDSARQQVVLFGGFSANSTALADTWTWDGNNWTQQNPATSPSPRVYHQLAYDEVRQETVLFGGEDFVDTDMISTTWVWNGANWIARTPAAHPPGAATSVSNFRFHSMVFDTAIQQVVLFGGYNEGPQSATWLWDGTNWTQFVGAGPGARYGTAMAYDSRNQQVVVFGGDFPTASGFYTFETWTFSTLQPTAAWVEQSPQASPPARASASMVFDSRRQQAVMFGGSSSTSFLGDTWTWNGATWTLAATTGPPARVEPAFAYDELHQQAVLFSGGGVSNDTWIWDGVTWTQRFPVHSPLGGVGVAMAYDGARQQVVLYGGKSGTTCLTDTWTWDGIDWTQKSPAMVPAPNSDCGAAMTYDDTRQQVILVTAVFGVAPDKTYTWDGANWTLQAPATPLPQRYRFQGALAYDSLRQKAVQFGGFSSIALILAETWRWDGGNWAQLLTTSNPAARTTAAMVYDPVRQRTVLFGGVGQDSIGQQLVYGDTWTLNPTAAPPAVNITVPAGIQFMFNGVTYTGSQSIVIAAGTYMLTTSSPVPTGVGTQLRFASWSDGGAQTHNVTVGASDLNITGAFQTQYLLTLSTSPANGGLIAVLGGPYYDAGTNVQVSALANLGFTFAGWAGACGGVNGCTVTMNAPKSVIATFNSQTFNLTINVPAGVHYSLSGLGLTGPATLALPQNTYSIAMASPQAIGTGVQTVFVSWSDGGALSHDVVLGAAAKTVTATFKTQYQVTIATTPANQGTASFAGGPFFDVGSQIVVTAIANPGYVFEFWTGGCTGSNAFCIVTVNVPLNLVAHFSVPSVDPMLRPATSPSARIGYSLAYDPVRQEVVLFGGFGISDLAGPGGLLSDTWTWNGTTWTQQFPAVHPSARSAHSMAYHSGSQSVVLFGGATGLDGGFPRASHETWSWNGQLRTWTQKQDLMDNSLFNGRIGSFLTNFGNNVLLFGGVEPDNQTGGAVDDGIPHNDTWIFDGNVWAQVATAHAPAGRYDGAIAYDAIRGQAVLSGGGTVSLQCGNKRFTDTWIYNGNDWHQANPATTLTDSLAAAAFDASLQQVVGLPISGTGNMWTWDGADWTKREAQMPAFDVAYDAARQQVMGVGYTPVGGGFFASTTYIRVAGRTSLALSGAPGVTLDPVTNEYVVTVMMANQGNVPLTVTSITSARLGLTNGSNIVLSQVPPVLPAQTIQVTARFPHNSASGRAALTMSGTYAAPPVSNSAGWSITIAVNLP